MIFADMSLFLSGNPDIYVILETIFIEYGV
jgi:hypothetical protein